VRLAKLLGGFTSLYSSNLLEAELLSVMRRESVERAEVPALQSLSWVLPDRRLGPELEKVLAAGYLRGADLWHVACCLYLVDRAGGVRFVTVDERQASVALAVGLDVVS
jgi:hypothetical protein